MKAPDLNARSHAYGHATPPRSSRRPCTRVHETTSRHIACETQGSEASTVSPRSRGRASGAGQGEQRLVQRSAYRRLVESPALEENSPRYHRCELVRAQLAAQTRSGSSSSPPTDTVQTSSSSLQKRHRLRAFVARLADTDRGTYQKEQSEPRPVRAGEFRCRRELRGRKGSTSLDRHGDLLRGVPSKIRSSAERKNRRAARPIVVLVTKGTSDETFGREPEPGAAW